MDTLMYMNKAISKTGAISFGTEFNLKELFNGVDWNALSVGERRVFGKYFKNEVLEGHVPNVVLIGKSQNNSAKYRKVLK